MEPRARDISESKSSQLVARKGEKGMVPPHHEELEVRVLGALLLERDALHAVVDILHPSTFYREAHQRVFEAVLVLFQQGSPIDLVTVAEQLQKLGQLKQLGGAGYLAQLTHAVSSAAHIEVHARLLLEYAVKREVGKISAETYYDSFSEKTDPFELLDKAGQRIFDAYPGGTGTGLQAARGSVLDFWQDVEERQANPGQLLGVPSGFGDLDRMTGGWKAGELTILAARPGMGKTAFLLDVVRFAAVERNLPVAFFSLEMGKTSLIRRLSAQLSGVPLPKIKAAAFSAAEKKRLEAATNRIGTAPIFLDDASSAGVAKIRASCRKMKAKGDLQLVVIDYLQLLQGDKSAGYTTREQEIASITRGLKCLAKDLGVPVLVASQLSRAVEARASKRPQLSDLRESGAIEQDADLVSFLYRPAYYGIETLDSGAAVSEDFAQLIIAKHRDGELGDINLSFQGKHTSFRTSAEDLKEKFF